MLYIHWGYIHIKNNGPEYEHRYSSKQTEGSQNSENDAPSQLTVHGPVNWKKQNNKTDGAEKVAMQPHRRTDGRREKKKNSWNANKQETQRWKQNTFPLHAVICSNMQYANMSSEKSDADPYQRPEFAENGKCLVNPWDEQDKEWNI